MTEKPVQALADPRAECFRMDSVLFEKLPDAYLAGAHLPLLYRFAHPRMRLNEMSAFRLVRDLPELPLTTDSVLRIYRALTGGTALEGKGFKTEDCCIESAEFVYFPTPAARTAAATEDLCTKYGFLNNARQENMDDIFRFLLEFICIHPVEDGNGRLSVFLIQLLLRKAGLRCAPFLPYDYLQNRMYRSVYQKHIVKASGIFYGQKPLEYEPFVRFTERLLLDSYRFLSEAADSARPPH